jgi:hypothetical protein
MYLGKAIKTLQVVPVAHNLEEFTLSPAAVAQQSPLPSISRLSLVSVAGPTMSAPPPSNKPSHNNSVARALTVLFRL